MMLFVASVITIGEMRSLTTPKPLKSPVTSPTLIAAAAAGAILASCPSQSAGEDDGGSGQHPGDRQVDAAGQHDDGLADGRKAKERGELRELKHIGGGGEARRQPIADENKNQREDDEQSGRGRPETATPGDAGGRAFDRAAFLGDGHARTAAIERSHSRVAPLPTTASRIMPSMTL